MSHLGSSHSLSEEEFPDLTLPPLHSLGLPGLNPTERGNIVGNFFSHIDRSGRIVKTAHDIAKERNGLVQLVSEVFTFEDPNSPDLNWRNIKEAVENITAEQEEAKLARAEEASQ